MSSPRWAAEGGLDDRGQGCATVGVIAGDVHRWPALWSNGVKRFHEGRVALAVVAWQMIGASEIGIFVVRGVCAEEQCDVVLFADGYDLSHQRVDLFVAVRRKARGRLGNLCIVWMWSFS